MRVRFLGFSDFLRFENQDGVKHRQHRTEVAALLRNEAARDEEISVEDQPTDPLSALSKCRRCP